MLTNQTCGLFSSSRKFLFVSATTLLVNGLAACAATTAAAKQSATAAAPGPARDTIIDVPDVTGISSYLSLALCVPLPLVFLLRRRGVPACSGHYREDEDSGIFLHITRDVTRERAREQSLMKHGFNRINLK